MTKINHFCIAFGVHKWFNLVTHKHSHVSCPQNKKFPHDNSHSTTTMGIKGAASILFSIKGITITGLKHVARSRLTGDQRICCIDVDCSWLGYKLGRDSSTTNASVLTAEMLVLLSKAGFIVTPICDPPTRHQSKRASTERISQRRKRSVLMPWFLDTGPRN